MADIGVPSFSLGLDLDFDSEPQLDTIEESVCSQDPDFTINVSSSQSFEEEEDFQSQILDQNLQVEDPIPVLKRLRRGPPRTQLSTVDREKPLPSSSNVDDEIENFSSQEDPSKVADERMSVQNRSVCSSSKFPLHGHRVLITQPVSKPKPHANALASSGSISTNLDASENKLKFPNLTISPLRRFQLLDSDSDEPSSNEDLCKVGVSGKEKQYNPSQAVTGNQQKRAKIYENTPQTEDLWKNFSPRKSVAVPTPALDEFCEEYFRSLKNKSTGQSKEENILPSTSKGCFQKSSINNVVEQHGNFPNPLPPAYRYFYHNDSRIQRLVRDRLANFFPLGAVDNRGNNQSDEAIIDYMNQFGHREHPSQLLGTRNKALERSRGRNNSKNSNAKNLSETPGSWVNPKISENIPKDAGKRRVHADGRSSGQWYTSQDGTRIYVTRNGQELTGQIAYRQYRKESGSGFKRSRKKPTSKKKSKR